MQKMIRWAALAVVLLVGAAAVLPVAQAQGQPAAPAPAAENADIRRLERELSEIVGAAIAIEHKAGGKGRMVISYASLDQLDGILRYFRPGAG